MMVDCTDRAKNADRGNQQGQGVECPRNGEGTVKYCQAGLLNFILVDDFIVRDIELFRDRRSAEDWIMKRLKR